MSAPDLPPPPSTVPRRRRRGVLVAITVAALAVVTATGAVAAGHHRVHRPPPGGHTPPTTTHFTEQLAVPQTVDARAGGPVTLEARSGTHRFHGGLPPAPSWGYAPAGSPAGDTYLGPTVEVTRGRPVDLTVANRLGASPTANAIDPMLMGVTPTDATAPRTALHLHGGHVPASEDGGPTDTFTPGQSHTYHYANDQAATMLWFHDHALGTTRLGVVNGLAGTYLVRDGSDTGRPGNAEGLPTGAQEMPLVLQDKAFTTTGAIDYPTGTPGAFTKTWIPEYFGDTAVVNGKASPNLDVGRGVYRFHLLDASNARFWDLALSDPGVKLYKIGGGGGLLNAPVPMSHLLLAPGDRADVLIDFRAARPGAHVVLHNTARAPYPDGPATVADGGFPLPDVMQFTVGARTLPGAVPGALRGRPGQPAPLPAAPPSATANRTVYLNEILDPVSGDSQRVLLNNQTFDSYQANRIEHPAAGGVEEWDIVNTTGDAHPMHLHLAQFRVLNRQALDVDGYVAGLNAGRPGPGLPDPSAAGRGPWPAPAATPFLQGTPTTPTADEAGWSDVVVVPPGQVTRIVVAFGGTDAGVASAPYTRTISDPTGAAYVWHCHILEHEDNDMMQQMRVG